MTSRSAKLDWMRETRGRRDSSVRWMRSKSSMSRASTIGEIVVAARHQEAADTDGQLTTPASNDFSASSLWLFSAMCDQHRRGEAKAGQVEHGLIAS